ncbi:MAG: hypothetical protein IAE81_14725 [Caldilineaceae bacterium]|nr:hypothetical protein [Caldilineaceae bacterium]
MAAPTRLAPAAFSLKSPAGDEPLEINAAYAAIRQALSGTTLYKTSLREGVIVLSFISPQVGRRQQATINLLVQGKVLRQLQASDGVFMDSAENPGGILENPECVDVVKA